MQDSKGQESSNNKVEFAVWLYLGIMLVSERDILDEVIEKVCPGFTWKNLPKAQSFNDEPASTTSITDIRPRRPRDFHNLENCLKKMLPQNKLLSLTVGAKLLIYCAFKRALKTAEAKFKSDFSADQPPAESKNKEKTTLSSFTRWSNSIVFPMAEALANAPDQDPIQVLLKLAEQRITALTPAPPESKAITTPVHPSLLQAVKILVGFHQQPDVIPIIYQLLAIKDNSEKEKAAESIRNKLNKILLKAEQKSIENSNRTLCDAAYQALLEVACYAPLNQENMVTLDPVDPANCIFISTGHQFDIKDLIHFHNKRNPVFKLGETAGNKFLLNYYTGSPGSPFSDRDKTHILRFAAEKGISVNGLQKTPSVDTVAMSAQEKADAEVLTQALLSLRQIGELIEAKVIELLKAKKSQHICELIAALRDEQALTPPKVKALLEDPEYVEGLRWGQAILQDAPPAVAINRGIFFRQAPGNIFLLAYVLDVLKNAEKLTDDNVKKLFAHADGFIRGIIQLRTAKKLIPANVLLFFAHVQQADGLSECLEGLVKVGGLTQDNLQELLKHAEQAKGVGQCLKSLQAADMLTQRIFTLVLEQAPFAVGLGQCLASLQKINKLNKKTFDVLLENIQFVDSLGPILESMADRNILNDDILGLLFSFLPAKVQYIEDLSNIVFCLRAANVLLTPKNVAILLDNVESLAAISNALFFLQKTNILSQRSFFALLEKISYINIFSHVVEILYRAQSLTGKHFNILLKHVLHIKAFYEELIFLQKIGVVLTPKNCASLLAQLHYIEVWRSALRALPADPTDAQKGFLVVLEHWSDIVEIGFWRWVHKHLSEKQLFDETVKKVWQHLTGEQLLKISAFLTSAGPLPGPRLLKPHDFDRMERWLAMAFPQGINPLTLGAKLLVYCLLKTGLDVTEDVGENEEETVFYAKWGPCLVPCMASVLAAAPDQEPMQVLASFAEQRAAILSAETVLFTADCREAKESKRVESQTVSVLEAKEFPIPPYETKGQDKPVAQSTTPLIFFNSTWQITATTAPVIPSPAFASHPDMDSRKLLQTQLPLQLRQTPMLTLKKADFLPAGLAMLTDNKRVNRVRDRTTSLERLSQAVALYLPVESGVSESKSILPLKGLRRLFPREILDQMLEYEEQGKRSILDDLQVYEGFLQTLVNCRLNNITLLMDRGQNSLTSTTNSASFTTSYKRFTTQPTALCSTGHDAWEGFSLHIPIHYSLRFEFPNAGLEIHPQVDFQLKISVVDAHYFGISALLAPDSAAKALLTSYQQQLFILPAGMLSKLTITDGAQFTDVASCCAAFQSAMQPSNSLPVVEKNDSKHGLHRTLRVNKLAEDQIRIFSPDLLECIQAHFAKNLKLPQTLWHDLFFWGATQMRGYLENKRVWIVKEGILQDAKTILILEYRGWEAKFWPITIRFDISHLAAPVVLDVTFHSAQVLRFKLEEQVKPLIPVAMQQQVRQEWLFWHAMRWHVETAHARAHMREKVNDAIRCSDAVAKEYLAFLALFGDIPIPEEEGLLLYGVFKTSINDVVNQLPQENRSLPTPSFPALLAYHLLTALVERFRAKFVPSPSPASSSVTTLSSAAASEHKESELLFNTKSEINDLACSRILQLQEVFVAVKPAAVITKTVTEALISNSLLATSQGVPAIPAQPVKGSALFDQPLWFLDQPPVSDTISSTTMTSKGGNNS